MAVAEGEIALGEVLAIVREIDTEGASEAAGARPLAGSADEDATGDALRFSNDVEHVVDAVVEVDVSVSGRTEDDAGAGGEAGEGVGGGIVVRKVGFGFVDAGVEIAMDEEAAEQFAGDGGCGSGKEATI